MTKLITRRFKNIIKTIGDDAKIRTALVTITSLNRALIDMSSGCSIASTIVVLHTLDAIMGQLDAIRAPYSNLYNKIFDYEMKEDDVDEDDVDEDSKKEE